MHMKSPENYIKMLWEGCFPMAAIMESPTFVYWQVFTIISLEYAIIDIYVSNLILDIFRGWVAHLYVNEPFR